MTRGGVQVVEHRLTVPLDHDAPAGGPGHEAPRPVLEPLSPSWLTAALPRHAVLLLDQRGTGLSTPWGGPAADPSVLRHLRADAVVRDAEAFREHRGVRRWSLLGQSFGGFCALHYRSRFPDSLRATLFTGGVPPVGVPPEEVYAATYGAVAHLEGRSLRTVGNQLGMHGGSEALHALLERDPRSPAFAHDAVGLLPFSGRNPLYAVVHESCYADGTRTGWAADHAGLTDHSEATLTLLPGVRAWRSDRLHNALRHDGPGVLGRLLDLADA